MYWAVRPVAPLLAIPSKLQECTDLEYKDAKPYKDSATVNLTNPE